MMHRIVKKTLIYQINFSKSYKTRLTESDLDLLGMLS